MGLLSPIGYTGYQREKIPDRYHAISRSYDASLGRFQSRDVEAYLNLTDTLTLNRYLYCGANPLSYVDVMGFGFTDYVEGGWYLLTDYSGACSELMQTVSGGLMGAARRSLDYTGDSMFHTIISGLSVGAVNWAEKSVDFTLTTGLDMYRLCTEPRYQIRMTWEVAQEELSLVKDAYEEIREKGIGGYASHVAGWFDENIIGGIKSWWNEEIVTDLWEKRIRDGDAKLRAIVAGEALPEIAGFAIGAIKAIKALKGVKLTKEAAEEVIEQTSKQADDLIDDMAEHTDNLIDEAAELAGKSGSTTIHNDILDSPRVGSALTVDDVKPIYKINEKTGKPQIVKEFPATAQSHGFNDIIDNYAGYATKTPLNNATLYQLDGSLNGVAGRFEWIIQDGNVTHRMFIQNGTMNGVPIKP